MGERKVLNKYYPPDFDPAKLPKGKRQDRNEMKVRMMLPMSVRCRTCGNFMYKGTKFNTRKEDVEGETYLGIQVIGILVDQVVLKCAAAAGAHVWCELTAQGQVGVVEDLHHNHAFSIDDPQKQKHINNTSNSTSRVTASVDSSSSSCLRYMREIVDAQQRHASAGMVIAHGQAAAAVLHSARDLQLPVHSSIRYKHGVLSLKCPSLLLLLLSVITDIPILLPVHELCCRVHHED